MKLCAACDSVVPTSVCPHCGAAVRNVVRSTPLVRALGLVVTTLAMQACSSMYGIAIDGDDSFDGDGDGWAFRLDCDDTDPDIHPGAEETAGDSVDSNCDGSDDPQT